METAPASLLAQLPAAYRPVEGEGEDSSMTRASFDAARSGRSQRPELSFELDGREDLTATLIAFRRLLGEIATLTNETPRSILEDEFRQAPSDEFWRATIGAEK